MANIFIAQPVASTIVILGLFWFINGVWHNLCRVTIAFIQRNQTYPGEDLDD